MLILLRIPSSPIFLSCDSLSTKNSGSRSACKPSLSQESHPNFPNASGDSDLPLYGIEPPISQDIDLQAWLEGATLAETSPESSQKSQPWIRGSLKQNLHRWERITTDQEVLSIIRHGWRPKFGYCLQTACFYARKPIPSIVIGSTLCCSRCKDALSCLPPPPSFQENKPEFFLQEHHEFITKTFQELHARVVIRTAKKQEVQNIAPLGIAVQRNGKKRMFYACTFFNRFLRNERFKYESMRTQGREVFATDEPQAAGWSIDLFSAFHFVDVAQDAQKFLGFRDLQSQLCVWQGMPFGVSQGPRIFTMLLRPPVAFWRSAYRASFVHLLDDFTSQASTPAKARHTSDQIVKHLQDLGFIIQEEKVVSGLSIIPRALGFKVDLPQQKFFLPDDRVQDIAQQAQRILAQHRAHPAGHCVQAIDLVSLAGKIVSGDIAIGPRARIFTRALYSAVYDQFDKRRSSATSYDNLRRYIYLPPSAAQSLGCWANPVRWNTGFSIAMPHICLPPEGFVQCDASNTGWGSALFVSSDLPESAYSSNSMVRRYGTVKNIPVKQAHRDLRQGIDLAGLFSASEKEENSTIREGLGVLRTFRRAELLLSGAHLHLHIDNQALAFCLGGAIPRYDPHPTGIPSDMKEIFKETLFPNLYGGSSGASLQRIVEGIFNIADDAAFTFTAIWVPRALNERADLLSHAADNDHSDYYISRHVLSHLADRWKLDFQLDVFASPHTALLPRFYSKFYHPDALAIDAFNQSWNNKVLWLHPPVNVIGLTLEYAKRQQAVGVLIVPQWPRQGFYAKLLGSSGNRIPTPAYCGGPPFIRDTFRLGLAHTILQFTREHNQSHSIPQGMMWAIYIDFRQH